MSSTGVYSDGRDHARFNWFDVPVLCIGYALGSCSSTAIPLWVAAIVKAGTLSAVQVGWLASGELFSIAISVLTVSSLGKHANPRRLATAAASVAAVANAVAIFGAFQCLIIGRLVSGVAIGVLLATVTRVAASRPHAQRVLSLMQAASVLLVSIVYFVSPSLIDRFGPAGFFAILAGVGIITIGATLIGFPAAEAQALGVTRSGGAQKLAPLTGCLAVAVVFIGQSSVGTYIITIGNGLGFDAHTMGAILAVAFPIAMLGPIAAHRLGERMGLLRPLLLALVLLAIDIVLLVRAASPILFCLFSAAIALFSTFCVPYVIAFLGYLDRSGRFASAATAFMMVGGAVGPALGGTIIAARGFQALALVAVLCIAAGIALFAAAAGLDDRELTCTDRRKS
jgi:predicted MFS family arabinose efflux permease